jgi:hypothetical protein
MKRFIRNRRGQVRVIEAFFAAVLMLSSLAFIPTVTRSKQEANGVLSSKALDALVTLDADGHLSELADQRNWTALESCVKTVIPTVMWFNLTVFDENMTPLNSVLISNGGVSSNHVEAADYLTASASGTYAIYTLRLQLAGLD